MAGYDLNSINALGSDPMFLAALNSYNPNFMATYANTLQTPQVTQPEQLTIPQGQTLPEVDYTQQEADSNTGLVTGLGIAAAGAAATIYAAKKGKGNILEGFKSIFKGAKDAVSKNTDRKLKMTESLKNIRVVMKNGTPVYYIPGKTASTKDVAEIQKLIKDNTELKKLTGFRFNSGETKINSGTFEIKSGNQRYSITFDGEKVTEIKQLTEKGKGNIVTSKYVDKDQKLLENLKDSTMQDKANAFRERLNKILQGDFKEISSKETNLSNFTYTTKMGDNVANVSRKQISTKGAPSDNIVIKELTTLKEFQANDQAVIAEVRRSREKGVNVDSILSKDFLKDHKLPEGYKIKEFELQDGKNVLKIVDNEVAGITIGGKFYHKNSDECLAYLEQDKKGRIAKLIMDKTKNNKIPQGATIVPV